MAELNLMGKIQNGTPIVHGSELYEEFLKQNNNKDFYLRIITVDKNNSEKYVDYILSLIVPAFIKGYLAIGKIINTVDAIKEINDCCNILVEESSRRNTRTAFYNFRTRKSDCELNSEQLLAVIEELHIYCAENFNIIVGPKKAI